MILKEELVRLNEMTQNIMKSLEKDINSEIEVLNIEIHNSKFIDFKFQEHYFKQLQYLNDSILTKTLNFRSEIHYLISDITKN